MLALSLVPRTDMLTAVPRNLIEVHGERMALGIAEIPLSLGAFDPVYLIASRTAMFDAGVAWLFSMFDVA